MKKIILALFISSLLSILSFSALASHMAGSEISYSCTSTPGVWQVTFVIYRDCQGIPICSGGCGAACGFTMNLQGADASCNGTSFGTFGVNLVSVTDASTYTTCISAKNICTNMGCVNPGSFTPGMEKYTFQGTVNLGATSTIPSSCCNVRIWWDQCCRNGSITTGSAGNNFYTEAIINRCLSASPCNSSPYYTNDFPTVICGGQPFIQNMGAIDPDNDSLSFAFAPGLQGAGVSIAYNAPYAYDAPMPYTGAKNGPFPTGISCDPITGDIMFTPQYGAGGQLVGVVVVEVKQWKTIAGVPTCIGITRRDVQLFLITCPPNNPPTILTKATGSLSYSQNYFFNAQKGVQLCFDVVAKDTDFYPFNTPPISDTTNLNWNNALTGLGASFTKNYVDSLRRFTGPREDNMKFCWTPTLSAVNSVPYFLTITAVDKRCPNSGRITRAIKILVCDTPGTVNFINQINHCTKWDIGYYLSNNSGVMSTKWDVSNTKGTFNASNITTITSNSISNFDFPETGKYVIRLTLNSGTSLQSITYDTVNVIYATTKLSSSHSNITTCANTPTKIKSNIQGGISPYTFSWKDSASNVVRSSSDSIFLNNYTGKSKYYLTVTSNSGCILYDSFYATVNNIPILTRPQPLQICKSYKLSVINPPTTNQPGGTGIWNYLPAPGGLVNGTSTQVKTDSLKNLPIDTLNYTSAIYFDNWISYSYTAPISFGGCTNYDSAIVRVFGNPYADAGFHVKWCKNAGIYKLQRDLTRPAPYNVWDRSPFDPLGQGIGEDWTGNGVNKIVVGTSTYFEFDPNKSGVLTSPSINILTYKFTKQYIGASAPSCSGQDTTTFEVMPVPTVNPGTLNPVCSKDAPFSMSIRSGATTSSGSGGFWTYALLFQLNGINLAINDSQTFDPSKVTISSGSQSSWKLYYNDISTGCPIKDSLTITVAKSPTVNMLFDANSTHAFTTFLNSGNVNLTSLANPSGGVGAFTSTPSTPAFSINAIDPTKANFNTNYSGLNRGVYALKYAYTTTVPSSTTTCTSFDIDTITIANFTSFKEQNSFDYFYIYPNPTNGFINIELRTNEKLITIEVFDIIGKEVSHTQYNNSKNDFNTSLDLSSLNAGIYFMKVMSGNKSSLTKVIIN